MVQEANHAATTPDKASTTNTADTFGEEKRKKVGNYIILKTIGEGSFAKVRMGVHLITDVKVAVKVINKREVFKRNYLRANLRREASMMQRMSHPNIVQLHEVMETENSYYIVMDLVQGSEFVKYLTKKKQLDENETRRYIRQIVSAVDHMHRAHVIHRDIKLQNFMLDQNNDIIIIDFGLSNCLDEKGFLTTQCGSPAYAAPEIFAHQEYGPAVDIWSIGVNMYAMLMGKLPFKVENRSRNLAKLHACILKGCEIPTFLSPDCQDLLSRLLDPSPTKRITMEEIFRHPFLNYQQGPIESIPYKPQTDPREINRTIVQYLSVKYGYSEHEIEDAILHRKPIACRALYSLIERRLKDGLGWPDRTYSTSISAHAPSTSGAPSIADGSSDGGLLDKLGRHEPLLPGRRAATHLQSQRTSPSNGHGRRLSREKSNYGLDEGILPRHSTVGLTQEALNELVPPSRLAAKKSFHDIIARKPSALANHQDTTDDARSPRRMTNGNLAPIKPLLVSQRVNPTIPSQQTNKARSLPNSTLDHANQNGFHLPHDPLATSPAHARRAKNLSRVSHVESTKKGQQHSPVRYNPASSVTVKAIGLFLKNSTLHSRVSSCSSKSSKSNSGTNIDQPSGSPAAARSHPSKPALTKKSSTINYHSHGTLPTPSTTTRSTLVKATSSPHHLPTHKTPHTNSTTTTPGPKLMPT